MIYFVQQGKLGPIKIGYTGDNDISKRIASIQTYSPEKLVLLGYIEGEKEQERKLHRLFHAFKLEGEWFEPHPQIINYILNLIFGIHIETKETTVPPGINDGIPLDDILNSQEERCILFALQKTNGNIMRAADILKISYRSIRHRIKKLNIIYKKQ